MTNVIKLNPDAAPLLVDGVNQELVEMAEQFLADVKAGTATAAAFVIVRGRPSVNTGGLCSFTNRPAGQWLRNPGSMWRPAFIMPSLALPTAELRFRCGSICTCAYNLWSSKRVCFPL